MSQFTRRRLSASVAAAGFGAFGGCIQFGSTTFSLRTTATGVAESFLLRGSDRPLWIARHTAALDAQLVDSGTVQTLESTVDGRISHPDETPPAAISQPRFLDTDGYHRISVSDATRTTVDEWVVWLEPVESAPSDARRIEQWRSELGSPDTTILSRAALVTRNALNDGSSLAGRPPRRRGYTLFDPLSTEETALAPNPPFGRAVLKRREPSAPDRQPVRLRVERADVETTRYTNTADRVATDRSGLESYLASNVLDATFDGEQRSSQHRQILDQAGDGGYTEESDSPSDQFRTLLQRLGVETFDHDGRFVETVTYRYDDTHYRATYTIE